jgi:hypothetical protein
LQNRETNSDKLETEKDFQLKMQLFDIWKEKIHSKAHWFCQTSSSSSSVKSFLILNVLWIFSYRETEKPGPQLGLLVIEELWLCLQKCREEIYYQPLEAFAIKTSYIAQSMSSASSLDIKVKILATTEFVFYITKKKLTKSEKKSNVEHWFQHKEKKKKKRKRTQPSIAFRDPLTTVDPRTQ